MRFIVFLNGAVVAGYQRRKNAENEFARLVRVTNNEKNVLYCLDKETVHVFASNR